MIFERWIPVDLMRIPGHAVDIGLPVWTGDNLSVRVGAEVTAAGVPVEISGTVTGHVILPSGAAIDTITGSSSGSRAWIDLPERAFVLPGRIQIALRVTDGSAKTVILAACATVRNPSSAVEYDPDDEVPTWAQVNEKLGQLDDALSENTHPVSYDIENPQSLSAAEKAQARTNIGAASDSDVTDLKDAVEVLEPSATSTDVGKALIAKTISGGKVTEYEFGDAGASVVVDPTLSHAGEAADAKTAGDAINALDSFQTGTRQEDITDDLVTGGYYVTDGGIGATVSTTRTSYNGASSFYKSVTDGDEFTITGSGGNGARLYCFTDSEFKIVEAAESNASYTDQTITAPTDGYLFINMYNNSPQSIKQTVVDVETLHDVIAGLQTTTTENAEAITTLGTTVSDMNSYQTSGGYIDLGSLFVDNTAYYTGKSVGQTVETPPAYNSTAASWMYEVHTGDEFVLTGHGGGNSRLWCFTNANKSILSVSDSNITETNLHLTAAADGYLFINVYMSDPHSISIYSASRTLTLKEKIAQIDSAVFGNFDWETLKGKTIAVIGDSISTNGDTGTDSNACEITVEAEDVGVELSAYLTLYDVSGGLSLGGHTFTSGEIGTEVTFTPVAGDVGKKIGKPNNYNPNNRIVWWEVMQEKFGNKTIPVCWSGSSITSHESGTDQYKTAHAWHTAQIRKCGIRTPGTMTRVAPDMIIIYRGTNDFSHSPYTLLTDDYFNAYNWQYPADDTVTGGYGYLEGIALTIKKLREAYPEAQIYLCTMNMFKRINASHFPTNNGINSLPQYNEAIRKAADFFGCGLIDFDKDGITFENMESGGYITESNMTHPTDKGHAVMGRKAIADVMAQYNVLDDGT